MKNISISCISSLLILVMGHPLWAVDRNVPKGHPTIQAAIDACRDGDHVVVSPGVYQGAGNCDLDFNGKAIVVRSETPEDFDSVARTIIDCQGSESAPHRGFIFDDGEGKDSIVSGFTIINGYATRGGAIYCEKSGPQIKWCLLKGNKAENGGAIACYQAEKAPAISNCRIIENNAKNTGGGIYCTGSKKLMIINCLISKNKTEGYGGGVYCIENKELLISNCTVVKNKADYGAGIYGLGDSRNKALVRNCIVWGNESGGIGQKFAWGGLKVVFSVVQGGWDGEGNIDEDPKLDSEAHLDSDSPCIDKGDPKGDYEEQVDIDDDGRVGHDRIDIGCDER
ncbi:MAG: right-handed parallel beta-helix repeat-containing protein [Phycisphaerae bacterium]|nr:right-handed parallel beta-helix repeat-containing protein [Phycisphaerae bacterium]